jgi:hypothetical protein
MKTKVAIVALLAGLLATAAVAEAHKLPFGPAKRAIQQETADVCSDVEGCRNWRVGPCRRRSFHRIDCVSRVTNGEGDACAWVSIARVPARSRLIRVHHKRIFC